MRIPVLFLLAAAAAPAQTVSFGLKAGAPFIDPAGPTGESRSYTTGGSVEVRLPASFALEASAMSPAPPVVTPYHAHSRSDLGIGAVGALGVRLRLAGRMWLAPEFRMTRWGSQQWTNRRNDPAFYLGFHF